MAGNLCNLDALIPRSDFAFDISNPAAPSDYLPLKANDLQIGSPLLLRKPDFQRETSFWSPEKVRDLVLAFSNEDLVPAVILWRSPNNEAFVIDGAHRLSSLMAWVNDDYGDGTLSQKFFGAIPEHQKKVADKARDLIEEAVGPYHKIQDAYKDERFASFKETATRLHHCHVVVQTLKGDTLKAEDSFTRINRQGVKIDETELTLIFSRFCPNAISARAVNQNGAGHPHWKKFTDYRDEIEKEAKTVHTIFFAPVLTSAVVKTTDVPIAGRLNNPDVLTMLLNAVNLANDIPATALNNRKEAEAAVPPDSDGSATAAMLKRLKKLAQRIHSEAPSSLGLNPFVYFYSLGGRHLPLSFLATLQLVSDLEKKDTYQKFSRVRAAFEEFLVANSAFIPQITRKVRGQLRGVTALYKYFEFCIQEFQEPLATQESVLAKLLASPDYKYLKPEAYDSTEFGDDFSSEVKSGVTIKHHLDTALRCEECKARMDYRAISHDHKLEKQNQGDGNPGNHATTHRYCNSARESLRHYFAEHGGVVPYGNSTKK